MTVCLFIFRYREEISKGTDLIVQGDTNAETFYVVESGEFDVYVNNNHVGSIPRGKTLFRKKPYLFKSLSISYSLKWNFQKFIMRCTTRLQIIAF